MGKSHKKESVHRDKEEVRLENPVSKLLVRYGVEIKKGRFKPFCHVSDQNSGKILNDQRAYCHVCGKVIDCFDIVAHFEGISNFTDQVKFLGGEELPDSPERKEMREQVQRMKEAQEVKKAEQEAVLKDIKEKTTRMHELRALLRKEKPSARSWPSKVWINAYNELQRLDYKVAMLLGDTETGVDINIFPEIKY